MPPLPVADDGTVGDDLEIAFSTHLTLVVQARLEFACGSAPQRIDLVVARAHCRKNRPRLQALRDAAQAALSRVVGSCGLRRQPLALSTRVGGQWHALWASTSGPAGSLAGGGRAWTTGT